MYILQPNVYNKFNNTTIKQHIIFLFVIDLTFPPFVKEQYHVFFFVFKSLYNCLVNILGWYVPFLIGDTLCDNVEKLSSSKQGLLPCIRRQTHANHFFVNDINAQWHPALSF